jgi:hypothetical protein
MKALLSFGQVAFYESNLCARSEESNNLGIAYVHLRIVDILSRNMWTFANRLA